MQFGINKHEQIFQRPQRCTSPFTNHCMIDVKGLSTDTNTLGTSLLYQPYLRWTASLNSLLLRFKSISFTGMTVSQLEAHFSAARSIALLVFLGREFLRSSNLSSSLTSVHASGIRFGRQEGRLPEETLRVPIQLAQLGFLVPLHPSSLVVPAALAHSLCMYGLQLMALGHH